MPEGRTFSVSKVSLSSREAKRFMSDPFSRQKRYIVDLSIRYEKSGAYVRRQMRLTRVSQMRELSVRPGEVIQLTGEFVDRGNPVRIQIAWNYRTSHGAGLEVIPEPARSLQTTPA